MTAARPVSPAARLRAVRRLLPIAIIAIPIVAIAWLLLPPATQAPDLPPSPVTGVVVAVDSAGLGSVSGFTLRIDGGFSVDLALGTLENATAFSPGHLAEHMATSEPLRVWYRLQDGVPVVYRLEDAPG